METPPEHTLALARSFFSAGVPLGGGVSKSEISSAMFLAQLMPAFEAVAVVPDDEDAQVGRALYVGVTGDVTLTVNGVDVLFKNVAVGILPVVFTKVLATGTTATDMVRLN